MLLPLYPVFPFRAASYATKVVVIPCACMFCIIVESIWNVGFRFVALIGSSSFVVSTKDLVTCGDSLRLLWGVGGGRTHGSFRGAIVLIRSKRTF